MLDLARVHVSLLKEVDSFKGALFTLFERDVDVQVTETKIGYRPSFSKDTYLITSQEFQGHVRGVGFLIAEPPHAKVLARVFAEAAGIGDELDDEDINDAFNELGNNLINVMSEPVFKLFEMAVTFTPPTVDMADVDEILELTVDNGLYICSRIDMAFDPEAQFSFILAAEVSGIRSDASA